MKRRQDLLTGLLVALLVHIALSACLGTLFVGAGSNLLPAFQRGDSAVELTLLPAPRLDSQPAAEEPDREVVLTEPAAESPVKPEDPEAAVPDSSELLDADMLVKGAREAPELVSALKPVYPLGARMRGEQGVVKVRVRVDRWGRAHSLTVAESSGYLALDRQAVKDLRRARFLPVAKSGQADEGEIVVPVHYRLLD